MNTLRKIIRSDDGCSPIEFIGGDDGIDLLQLTPGANDDRGVDDPDIVILSVAQAKKVLALMHEWLRKMESGR
jgi:hypothetical protein